MDHLGCCGIVLGQHYETALMGSIGYRPSFTPMYGSADSHSQERCGQSMNPFNYLHFQVQRRLPPLPHSGLLAMLSSTL